ASQRCKEPITDTISNAVGVDDLVKQTICALIQAATVQPVRRGSQAEDLHVRINLKQRVDELAVHRVAVNRDKMALVDHKHVDVSDLLSLVVNSLNARKNDLTARVTTTKAGRKYACRREWPNAKQFQIILLDQLR